MAFLFEDYAGGFGGGGWGVQVGFIPAFCKDNVFLKHPCHFLSSEDIESENRRTGSSIFDWRLGERERIWVTVIALLPLPLGSPTEMRLLGDRV